MDLNSLSNSVGSMRLAAWITVDFVKSLDFSQFLEASGVKTKKEEHIWGLLGVIFVTEMTMFLVLFITAVRFDHLY